VSETRASPPGWQAFRARFPVTERAVYMNTGWSGPSTREVVQAVRSRLEREAFDGPTTLEVRHEKALLVRQARAALASLIGAGPDDVALMYTTTEGINAVLRGLGLRPGDEVITCNLEHSSVMVPCYELGRQLGVEVKVVRSSAEEPLDELARLFEVAVSQRTKLVVVSHISYNRGTRLPVERIIRAAHDAGAFVLLDGAQSAGQIPIDVHALGVDGYSFPAHKYVLGPDGVGALYIRRELVERVAPPAVAHGASEYYDFEGHFTPVTASMRKFEMTTHSGPLLAGVGAAVALLRDTGIERIEVRILELSTRLIDGILRIRGAQVRSPLDPALRSGLVTFTVGDQDPNETCAALWQLRRVVGRVVNDKRVRLSIAAFNNEGDIDAALDTIEQLATRGLPPGAMSAQQFKELVAEEDD
jgi:selenocysteine lyase/cysteine desulfurase